jgi:hypothetical protein
MKACARNIAISFLCFMRCVFVTGQTSVVTVGWH